MKSRAQRLGFQIWELSHVLANHLAQHLADLDITVAQMGALILIDETPCLSTADLARAMFMTPQNLSLIVTKLESKSLVQRYPHETHGRVHKLKLTAQGQQILKKSVKQANAVDRSIRSAFSPTERELLPQLLRRCLHSVQTRK